MAVYVDSPMNIGGKFDKYCHLWADTLEELHSFAEELGLSRFWFQNRLDFPHYDISYSKRVKAVKLGALQVTNTQVVSVLHSNREARIKG